MLSLLYLTHNDVPFFMASLVEEVNIQDSQKTKLRCGEFRRLYLGRRVTAGKQRQQQQGLSISLHPLLLQLQGKMVRKEKYPPGLK